MTSSTDPTDIHFLSLAQAASHIRARELSPVDYTRALIARIEALEPQLNAFITRTFDAALTTALAHELEVGASKYRGPLHGIPLALKDCIDMKGVATTGNSRIAADNLASRDATLVAKLQEAGATVVGKTALFEFAHGGPSFDTPWPPPRNPWNTSLVTGGSSSGSAAAVAAGLVPGTIGTDTGGSIRVPASRCGITGLMPTPGLVSRAGVIPHAFTFDRCGPMARTVEDCAILLNAIVGYDPRDPGSIRGEPPDYQAALGTDLHGMRIGVLRQHWEGEVSVSPASRSAMEVSLDVLADLGAELEACRIPHVRWFTDIKTVIAETEVVNVHLPNLRTRPKDFGSDILSRMLPALMFTGDDYVQATRLQRRAIGRCQVK